MAELDEKQKQERLWNMLCHLTALAACLGIPFGNVLGPLIVWLVKKNDIPSVDLHGKESLNFQISMSIYMAVAALLCFIFIGFLLLIPLILTNVILVIRASIKVNNGETMEYPLSIRFIR